MSGSPESLVGRLGLAEFGCIYFTFPNENNYTMWVFLKKCHEQGLLYQGTDVMSWCNRCGAGLSQMEVAEGRKVTRHTTVFVRCPLVGREKGGLLVWTTTPWTLTSNVAAAVNPELTHLKLQVGDWVLYVGEGNYNRDRIQSLEAGGDQQTVKLHCLKTILGGTGEVQVLGQLKGSELVSLAYLGPLDHLEAATTPRRPEPLTSHPRGHPQRGGGPPRPGLGGGQRRRGHWHRPHPARLQGLRMGDALAEGRRLLINGAAGGVGTFDLQIVRSHGALVHCVDRGDKLATLIALGAQRVFDYTREDVTFLDDRHDLILDAIGRRPLPCWRRFRRCPGPVRPW